MLNENARKWVAALRSGDYDQGKRKLRSKDDKYCCLGVACHLASCEGIIPFPTLENNYLYRDHTGANQEAGLPSDVRKWLGLADPMGHYERDTKALFILNDSEDKTFSEIADVIESEPNGLFTESR